MFTRTLVREGGMIRPANAGDGIAANSVMSLYNAEADATLDVSELSGGHIFQGLTLTSDVVYTLPTAALIAAAFADMNIGDAYSFMVTNSQAAAFDVVIAVGVGITALGTNNSLSVPPQGMRTFTLVKTAAATFDLY